MLVNDHTQVTSDCTGASCQDSGLAVRGLLTSPVEAHPRCRRQGGLAPRRPAPPRRCAPLARQSRHVSELLQLLPCCYTVFPTKEKGEGGGPVLSVAKFIKLKSSCTPEIYIMLYVAPIN